MTKKVASKTEWEEIWHSLDKSRMPVHIAFIMDGNRRWAKEKSLSASMGHKSGVETFRRIVEVGRKVGIRVLTFYAFSAENWKRSHGEVSILLKLFEYHSRKERENLRKNGIRFQAIGDVSKLPKSLQKEFKKTEEYTKANNDLTLNLAVNYSSRDEIIHAVKSVLRDFKKGNIQSEDIDEKSFSRYLYTSRTPDPDLLVRTSGELRISNFLLWQCAYAEFYFTKKYWPDFDEKELMLAIQDYQKRDRRFGGTPEKR